MSAPQGFQRRDSASNCTASAFMQRAMSVRTADLAQAKSSTVVSTLITERFALGREAWGYFFK